jgi:signal transduction histidine kinase
MDNSIVQPDNIVRADTEQYRQEFIAILLRWSLLIVLFCIFIFAWVYAHEPLWTTGILLGTFIQFLPVGGFSLYLLRQKQTQRVTWIYLTSAIIASTAFIIFMPDLFILVGMIAYILFVRITMFLETRRAAFTLSIICMGLYLAAITIRTAVSPPSFEPFISILIAVLPILTMVIYILLDQVGTRYLQTALQLSEKARAELSRSYETLAESQETLSKLAIQLEGRNHDLSQVNEELKSFAYIISHDLRAPLINLKGFSSELRASLKQIEPAARTALPQLPEDEQEQIRLALEEDAPEALAFIESSVTRMDSFINALLLLSRYGRRSLNFECIDMNEIVQTTLKSLAHQTAEKEVAITVADLPQITADYVCLEQIMGNLLSNAINYLQPGRPGKVEIWAEQNELETRFHIRDNGRGIAAKDMTKLFEPFRRIGKNDMPGEGMGLAYVQTLVRRHNGRITCESTIDVGSTFTFAIARFLDKGGQDGQFE